MSYCLICNQQSLYNRGLCKSCDDLVIKPLLTCPLHKFKLNNGKCDSCKGPPKCAIHKLELVDNNGDWECARCENSASPNR
jgi:hypothetical protein